MDAFDTRRFHRGRVELRHLRHAEVFAVGDVAGAPKAKTAANVKRQVAVVDDHLVATNINLGGIAANDGSPHVRRSRRPARLC